MWCFCHYCTVLGDSITQSKSVAVCCDGMVVVNDSPTFLDALIGLFAVYYVFKVVYPVAISSTLEFFQRL